MPYNDPLKNSNLDNLAASAYALEHLVAKNKETAKAKRKEDARNARIGCGLVFLVVAVVFAILSTIIHFIIKAW